MNTAMDDGRQESPGEQTLSFRPVRDDDTFDAFAAGPAKGARRDDKREQTGDEEPAAGETGATTESEAAADPPQPVNFFAPRKPVTGGGRPKPGDPPASTPAASGWDPAAPGKPDPAPDKPADSASPGGPSLFVRPATRGGFATTDEAVPDQDEPAAHEETAIAPASDQAGNAQQTGEEPTAEQTSGDEPSENETSGDEPSDEQPSPAAELSGSGDELEPEDAQSQADELDQPGDEESPDEAQDEPSGEAEDEPSDSAEDEISAEVPDEPSAETADETPAENETSAADETSGEGLDETPDTDEASDEGPDAISDEGLDEASDVTPEAATSSEAPDEVPDEVEATAEALSPEAVKTSEEHEETSKGTDGTRTEELPAEAAEALMAALDALRESVADLRFGLDLPGAEEARQAQADLLAQLEDYVLPRVRTSTAPALIVVAGSTGAGKSTLVNSLAERNVSRTGVRRPTTGTPVLVCHPEDRAWFTEGELLGNLQRLDKPPTDAATGGIVVVATEKLPQGVALLDTPDIDSVVEEHHEVAHRMLDAADLWIFVTTAARYADAPAWNLLKLAKERGARLAIVLSRVPSRSTDVVLKHFVRMLTEYGLGEIDRFVIHESKVEDGRLPDSEVTELRLWLAELSVDEERRAQAVRETLNGVLNSFRTRVPALAKHLEAQVAFRTELRRDVESAFLGALGAIDKASKNGSLLHGEVLARWQDFAGSGDLMRSLRLRRRGRAARQAPERILAFKAAIRTGLESVIVAAANRAAEEVVARWRHRAELGAKLAEGLDRPSDNLVRHTSRAIASWQEHLGELVRTEGVAKRSVSKLVSFDPEALSLIFMVAMFNGSNGEGVPHRLVNALLGAESLRGIGAKALSDLRARIGMLFDEEAMRYAQALDSAGIPDESVATRLYQATYNLEVAR
ncbi:dynamin family protein [Nonomuraea sp. SYSU D8015]|uniref:dynamin family protein n=1 Tax=Nonomuraea sp. SYSU D8015 TaxID=2593644 RepID=UPI0021D2962A|nr:dynamin family protein [Nonomuraea sp. SYSU D8015]